MYLKFNYQNAQNIYNYWISNLLGFSDAAEFVNFGKKRFLFHESHRYYKNRVMGAVVHWRCVGYHRNNCRARATTKLINGQERVKINCKNHTHDAQSFYFSGYWKMSTALHLVFCYYMSLILLWINVNEHIAIKICVPLFF